MLQIKIRRPDWGALLFHLCRLAATATIVAAVVAVVAIAAAAAVAEQQNQNDDPPPVVIQTDANTVIVAHKNTSSFS